MSISVADELRKVNEDLAIALRDFHPPQTADNVRPDVFSRMRNIVERGMDCLRNLSQPPGSDTEPEITKYRFHLQQLIEMLPSFHAGMLAEKRRLEAAAEHLQSASAWAQGRTDSL